MARPGLSDDPVDRYAHDWNEHGNVVNVLVDYVADNGAPAIKAEYTSLLDVYHSLGASRASVLYGLILSWVIAAHEVIAGHARILPMTAGAVIGLCITAAICTVLHRARALVEKSALHRLGLRLFFSLALSCDKRSR